MTGGLKSAVTQILKFDVLQKVWIVLFILISWLLLAI